MTNNCIEKSGYVSLERVNYLFAYYMLPLLYEKRLCETKNFVQHGSTSVFLHSVAVAYYSTLFLASMNVKFDVKSLVRGAMLHDYFLYDWHEKSDKHRLHGFTHSKTALINAERDYNLNELEKNIIERHMFPLTAVPPTRLESITVCIADKICSTYEIFKKKNPYPFLRFYASQQMTK